MTANPQGPVRVVPEEPTEAMLDAFWHGEGESKEMRLRSHDRARNQWSRMLAAAPQLSGNPGQLPAPSPAAPEGVEGFDLVAHLHRARSFSERTFGPGARTAGVVDHIRKELREIEADPSDVMEWIDVVILAFDGAWRAGWTPEEIVAAIVTKQTKNEGRTWPDWRTTDPNKAIEHDRSHDPVPLADGGR